MKPTTTAAENAHAEFHIENVPGESPDERAKAFFIPGTESLVADESYVDYRVWKGKSAAWNGHQFEVITIKVSTSAVDSLVSGTLEGVHHETYMDFYYPVDPVIVEKDVDLAREAYANPTNDGWLFRHSTDKQMLDREVEIKAAAVAAFAPGIDKLQRDCNLQLRLYAQNPADTTAGSREQAARLKHGKLVDFRDLVLKCVEKDSRARYRGWYEQNPEQSHIHHIVHDCVTKLYHENVSDYVAVQAEIMSAAFSVHTFETRWEQAARLKAEADAAAAAQDGDSGD